MRERERERERERDDGEQRELSPEIHLCVYARICMEMGSALSRFGLE